jgi:hypothetical protein
VTVRVADRTGLGSTASFVVSLANEAPVVTSPGDQTAAEGSAAMFALGGFTDPGGFGPWMVTIDWGDGSAVETFTVDSQGDLGTLGHRYASYGVYAVMVGVDDGQATTSGSFDVSVANVAPSLALAGDQAAVEGSSTTFALGGFTDPGANGRWTVRVDWGDGSAVETFTVDTAGDLGTLDHRYASYGVYAVTLSVDDGQAVTSGSFGVDVSNVAPALSLAGDQTAVEGSSATLALGGFVDPGANGPWTVTIDWGDGSAVEMFAASEPGDLGAREHLYARYGTYAVGLTVSDGRGTRAGTFAVSVANVAPTPRVPADQEAVEGAPATIALGGFVDPGANGPWTVTIDWGDGSAVETYRVLAPGDLIPLNHVYPAGGAYSVLASVSDGRAARAGSFVVRVAAAAAPVVVVEAPPPAAAPVEPEPEPIVPLESEDVATPILGSDVGGSGVTVASAAANLGPASGPASVASALGNPGLLQALPGLSALPALVALSAVAVEDDAPADPETDEEEDDTAAAPPAAAGGDAAFAFMGGPAVEMDGTDVGDNGLISGPATLEGGSQQQNAATTAAVPVPPAPTLFGRAGGVQATIMALVIVHQRRSHTRSRRWRSSRSGAGASSSTTWAAGSCC